MKKMKKVVGVLLCLTMVVMLVACGSSGSGDSSDGSSKEGSSGKKIKIGVLLPNARGDNSIADIMYGAVEAAQKDCDFEFDYAEGVEPTDYAQFLDEFASSGEYDLIIPGTFSYADAMAELAPQYPDQKFLFWDNNVETGMENVWSAAFDKGQHSFLVGAFSALMDPYGEVELNGKTYTWDPKSVVGIVSGVESPDTFWPCSAYWAGAKYVNPDIDCKYTTAGSWGDQAKCKELAISLYEQGAAFVFQYLGAGVYGVVEAAEENDRFCFGFDLESNLEISPNVIAVPYNETNNVLSKLIKDFVENGTFKGDTVEIFGVDTGDQKIGYQEGAKIPEEVLQAMDEITEKVANGEIKIPRTFDEVEAFTDTYK